MSDLFKRMGGTRAMAEMLGEPASTVQSWKSAGRVPAAKQPAVIEAAERAGIAVRAEDVIWPFGRPITSTSAEAA
jgi:DNA-binding transcriptional regulator YdaS (Cro superfamily)